MCGVLSGVGVDTNPWIGTESRIVDSIKRLVFISNSGFFMPSLFYRGQAPIKDARAHLAAIVKAL